MSHSGLNQDQLAVQHQLRHALAFLVRRRDPDPASCPHRDRRRRGPLQGAEFVTDGDVLCIRTKPDFGRQNPEILTLEARPAHCHVLFPLSSNRERLLPARRTANPDLEAPLVDNRRILSD